MLPEPRPLAASALLLLLAACGSPAPKATAADDATASSGDAVASDAKPSAGEDAPAPAAPKAAADKDALEVRCDDSYLFLVDKTYEDMKEGAYCDACGDLEEDACGLDWPSSDLSPCFDLAVMRNTIYAYYGRPFEGEEWKRYFASRPWYAADPAYDDSRLSDVARANVAALVAAEESCRQAFCGETASEGMAYMCEPFRAPR